MVSNVYNKIKTVNEVVGKIEDGTKLMIGGFGGVGNPPTLISAILEKGVKDLTIICNDTGFPDIGVGKLITEGRVKKIIASHIGSNPLAGEQMASGKVEVEFSPQGTLAERIRAGGVGLGGILVDVGLESDVVEKGKTRIDVNGLTYLLETPLKADVAIIYGMQSDPFGNLIYRKSARNMNPLMAMAATYTIAEVEEIVPLGELNGESIITPGIFVQAIVEGDGVDWKWVWE
ncbi:CoA transferase subunit A [Metabacillus herbersteinensis]|uniref:CoA transferase subunit A n=1 Tax=Metabacillus herbersteinensis TaxID=283816 RepID=A0ABV6GKX2_9BACI